MSASNVLIVVGTFTLSAFAARANGAVRPDPPLQFSARLVAAPWCPQQRAMAAFILPASGSAWAVRPPSDYTVYVGGWLVAESMFKVTPAAVTVCVPRAGPAKVLVFGPDSKGRPAEFDSSATPPP